MLRNRLFALLGLLVIASMVLAACGAPASTTDAPADTTTDTTAATDEPAAPAEPKTQLGDLQVCASQTAIFHGDYPFPNCLKTL